MVETYIQQVLVGHGWPAGVPGRLPDESAPDDRTCRSDDSNGEIFKNVPRNSSTFRIWKIEVP
ncbi:hypothetical protein K0M31_018013 [Melipona bicolor]|uniref:Uncharacterized protein n=1 Tax=Melipona bicolor TaxID=60889 RepID=A0AA40FE54_9HYME|nr:hypothetical protein K0M31_018013 [Melipona bicolor]